MTPVSSHGDYVSAFTPLDHGMMTPQHPNIAQQNQSDEEMEALVWNDPTDTSKDDNSATGEILFQVWTEPSPSRINNIWSNRHHGRSVQPLSMRKVVDYSDSCVQTHCESNVRKVTQCTNNPIDFQIQCFNVDAYLAEMRLRHSK